MEIACKFIGLLLILLLGRQTSTGVAKSLFPPVVCPINSVKDFIFASPKDVCSADGGTQFQYNAGVVEGDEVALQKVLHMVHKNEHNYVALLFYASWCPFSGSFRPSYSLLSSIFPSIPHFAIEESAIRPSILSKYGVHGFPALMLMNSTMRAPYQGSRTLDSLIYFYGNITGIETNAADGASLEQFRCSGYDNKDKNHQETCPFPWAKSPENLLQQETYLALATIFVILRLLYFTYPTLRRYSQLAWNRYIINMSLSSSREHLLNRATQLLNSLKEPCKKSNLQEGAKNAKAWASKSLATVSFGDSSSSRDASTSRVQ